MRDTVSGPIAPPPELLARVLSGEATPVERDRVEAWAAAASTNRAELDRLRDTWTTAPPEWDVDRAWARTAARLGEARRQVAVVRLRTRQLQYALAAMLVLSVGAAAAWFALRPGAITLGAPQIVATAPGERRSLELSDGTTVTLAPGTELRVAADYGRTERRVDLVGEAWFDVAHDEDRPFRVHAAGTVTEDIGTAFTVRALPGTGLVRVVLVEGLASFASDAAPAGAVVLNPNDVGTLRAGDEAATVERVADVSALVSWQQGRLQFEDAPLSAVAADLSHWYGLEFRLADPGLGTRRLTATLPLDQLDEALEVLSLSLGLVADRTPGIITLR